MASLVFVHGTGVRLQRFQDTEKQVRAGLAEAFKGSGQEAPELLPCLWGNSVGAAIGAASGRSVPEYEATGGGDKKPPALWDVLAYDPFYELRVLALGEPVGAVNVNGYVARLSALPGDAARPALADLGVTDADFARARGVVRNDPAFEDAVEAGEGSEQLNTLVSRALVAALLFRAPVGAPLRTAPARRDALATALAQDLGGEGLGIFPGVARGLLSLADFFGASDALVERRGQVTDAILPTFADVVMYQGRGVDVRSFIRGVLRQALDNAPVVVLAHSLGGIACVDLLAGDPELAGRIKALVTVGSQAPLLYEMGALVGIPRGEAIPDHFPAWVNVYDRRDFLGFVGQDVFPKRSAGPRAGSVGIEDVEVDNRVSVVDAHSAYWSNPQLGRAVRNAYSR